jgi:bifunctional non-homologous end joining protein LigD
VRLLTRSGKDWTHRFAGIARAVAALPVKQAYFDGEAVVLDESGISRFQLLQNALDSDGFSALSGSASAAGSGAPGYVVFDLLHLDGRDLRALPLVERKEALGAALWGRGRRRADARSVVRLSAHVVGGGAAFHAAACGKGLEGIVSKRAASRYVSARTRDWLKVKCGKSQEFAIVGWTDPQGARTGFGALLLGIRDERPEAAGDGRLRFAGRVGTGFTDATLRDLRARMRGIERSDAPVFDPPRGADARGVHWLEPRLVGQVRFAEWTQDGLLRHPSFEGLREDKPVKDVVREREKHVAGPPAAPAGRPRAAGTSTGKASREGSPRRSRAAAAADAGPARASGEIRVEGVRVTHPERVLWPDRGLTKADLAAHYARVAQRMLPEVSGRPLSIVRCPEGTAGMCFFQKHATPGTPPEVKRISVKESDGRRAEYLMVDSREGLVGLAQIGALEVHVWGAREGDPDRPDRIVFDLDPAPGVAWGTVVDGLLEVRRRLAAAGLECWARSTGGKGLHAVVPLGRRAWDWDQVKAFAKELAESMAADAPDRYVSKASKAARTGKIFVDWLRNLRGATAIATWSPRARPGAPVAVPVPWATLRKKPPPYARVEPA